MSSNTNSNALTKEQLLACSEYNGLGITTDTVTKMKNMDGQALRDMGYRFHNNGDYSKAMVLYQHAVFQNYSGAYNNIGALYDHGQGVAQDYLTAMEYFLNAARDNHTLALSNIGLNILKGRGVPADKYKALEWLTKSGNKPDEIKELNQQGIQLEEKDKKKTVSQLVHETENIIRLERMKKEFQLTTEVYKLKEENNELNEKNNELKVENDQVKTRESRLKEEYNELKERESKSSEENQELKELKASNQQEIQRLWNELHQQATLFEQEKLKSGFSTQLISNLEQRLMDKTETINVYQTLVQAKNNEIKAMKIENENQELKRKLDEYERRSQSLIDNVNFTNDNNDNNNNTIQLDNQTSLNDTLNGSVDNIRVKIETESENDGSSSCQIGNKKRKVTSNDL